MTIQADVALADWCTLGVGGPARWFGHARSEEDLVEALRWAAERRHPVHVLGGGSNVVIADEGFAGLVIHVDIRGVDAERQPDRDVFTAGAGEPWDAFVAETVAADSAGLECLSGIPGLVGGTPVQNVGAYGQEVSTTIADVRVIDRDTLAPAVLAAAECGFGYRTSRFRHQHRFIVSRVRYVLAPHGPPTLAYADVVAFFAGRDVAAPPPSLHAVREAILQIRRRKGMVIEAGHAASRSVGSFFVNPIITRRHFSRLAPAADQGGHAVPHYPLDGDRVKVPAAWLIEHAGFTRGFTRGAVGISPYQAQAIVNHGSASACDVVRLAADVKRAVWRTFAVALVPEPIFVGFPRNPDLDWLLEANPSG